MIKHREVWDEQHYKYKRVSGLHQSDFAESNSRWDKVVFGVSMVLAVCIILLEMGHAFN